MRREPYIPPHLKPKPRRFACFSKKVLTLVQMSRRVMHPFRIARNLIFVSLTAALAPLLYTKCIAPRSIDEAITEADALTQEAAGILRDIVIQHLVALSSLEMRAPDHSWLLEPAERSFLDELIQSGSLREAAVDAICLQLEHQAGLLKEYSEDLTQDTLNQPTPMTNGFVKLAADIREQAKRSLTAREDIASRSVLISDDVSSVVKHLELFDQARQIDRATSQANLAARYASELGACMKQLLRIRSRLTELQTNLTSRDLNH